MTRSLIHSVLMLNLALALLACNGAGRLPGTDGATGPRVVTFNVGIPECSDDADAPYSCEDAAIAGEWYGTGLSHKSLFADTRAFFNTIRPDIVGLQEICHPEQCPEIPAEFHAGFICEDWRPGGQTVSQIILGEDYQIACHRGRPDKCLAVRRAFGQIRGCQGALCLDHLDGGFTDDCGGGTRIGRGVIDRPDGRSLTVVNIHGTSGITTEDQACRVEQFEQVFVDILDGSGEPAANGQRNLVLGDLNTDPGRLFLIDPSAATWTEHVGDGQAFRQISDAGPLATPSYADAINIDHVASDSFIGDCFAGTPTDIVAYDHMPIVCDLR